MHFPLAEAAAMIPILGNAFFASVIFATSHLINRRHL
jgi:hypothetical protein